MVSLQSPLRLSPSHRILEADQSSATTPQKRKTFELTNNHDCTEDQRQGLEKRPKSEFQNFMDHVELHLESPLPSEWQRCLDIQSGKIHFYNTKTHKRTSTDPRKMTNQDHDHDHDRHMSLDLELNLTTTSETSSLVTKDHIIGRAATANSNYYNPSYSSPSTASTTTATTSLSNDNKQVTKSGAAPPWLALEADRQEMVATVCVRCHMLVMLCRSSPACPNCKFVHPPEKTPSNFALERSKY